MKTAFIWTATGMREVERNPFGVQQYVRAEDAERTVDPPRARHTDPETSHIAAKASRAGHTDKDRWIISILCECPSNSYETSLVMGVPIEHISSRFAALERAGLIRKNGVRRPGHSGVYLANVYEVVR